MCSLSQSYQIPLIGWNIQMIKKKKVSDAKIQSIFWDLFQTHENQYLPQEPELVIYSNLSFCIPNA